MFLPLCESHIKLSSDESSGFMSVSGTVIEVAFENYFKEMSTLLLNKWPRTIAETMATAKEFQKSF